MKDIVVGLGLVLLGIFVVGFVVMGSGTTSMKSTTGDVGEEINSETSTFLNGANGTTYGTSTP